MKLLLTGFEPFGSSTLNPSEQIVQALREQSIEGIDLVTVILPVERFAGPDTLIRTFISSQPDVVLSLGQTSNRAAICVERVAVNLLDYLISDNGGHLVTDKNIVADGADGYFSTLPVRDLVNALNEAGIPGQLSNSAGTFLCNQVMYEILHYIAKHKLTAVAGFIHVPQLPEQTAGKIPAQPSMSLDTMIEGIKIIIETVAAWKQ